MSIRRYGVPVGLTANSAPAAIIAAAEGLKVSYQPYIDGMKEIREINEDYNAPFVRG